MEFFLVIEQGLNLMLTGMMTVFIFLGMLILLINLSSPFVVVFYDDDGADDVDYIYFYTLFKTKQMKKKE